VLHPFDNIFGKKIHQRMKQKRDMVERMNFTEFKTIEWDYKFPQFINDLINYISAFNIEEYLKAKDEREQEEEKLRHFRESMGRRREKGETLDEHKLLEQFNRENLSEADTDLLYLRSKIGDIMYKKFLRFFRNVCKNPAEDKES